MPVAAAPDRIDPGHAYAALDLGSNSFHLIVATYHGEAGVGPRNDGRLQVVDRHREMVRLADGLSADNTLSAAASERSLACLHRLGQRIRHLPRSHVRVVGTNTLRKARNSDAFMAAAQRALGHRIEIVSGREEARLIYLGVSHSLAASSAAESRLVVDVGGGSTELILGQQFEPELTESLHMGCVAMSARHFPAGRLTAEGFTNAENAARQELEVVERLYRQRGWDAAIGASGTMLAVHNAIFELTGQRGISAAGIAALKEHLVAAGKVSAVGLAAVAADRAPVFPGGLAIVSAVVAGLGIDTMTVASGALREGLLHDLLGRVHAQDVRETTVADLMRRYHVDASHAERVATTAQHILDGTSWPALRRLAARPPSAIAGAASPSLARRLRWGALLHEIGLDIAHSQYHKHGGYLLDNADLPGFALAEQHALALLVRSHRRKFPAAELAATPALAALSIVLRLAVLLHRGRSAQPLPRIAVAVRPERRELALRFPAKWLAAHPLTRLDLEQEAEYLRASDVSLVLDPPGP